MCEACILEDLSRRNLLKMGTGLLAGAAWAGNAGWSHGKAAAPRRSFNDPVELAPGVFFLEGSTTFFEAGTSAGPSGNYQTLMCNNGWVIFDDFVLVVDANLPARAEALIEAIRKTTDKPIRFVLNTHHHGDHIYGNKLFVEREHTRIVSHEGLTQELKQHETGYFGGAPGRWETVAKLRPDVAATPLVTPTETFSTSRIMKDRAGREVHLLHLGRGHTSGDAWVWLPKERVLFAGDMLTNGPYNIVRDSFMGDWVSALGKADGLGAEIVLPGHGPAGEADLVTRQKAYWEAIRDIALRHKRAGTSWKELEDSIGKIRVELESDDRAVRHLIPQHSELPILSLGAHLQRYFEQLA